MTPLPNNEAQPHPLLAVIVVFGVLGALVGLASALAL